DRRARAERTRANAGRGDRRPAPARVGAAGRDRASRLRHHHGPAQPAALPWLALDGAEAKSAPRQQQCSPADRVARLTESARRGPARDEGDMTSAPFPGLAPGLRPGQIVIAGIGATAFGKLPGRDTISMNVEACRLALADAGVEKERVDALLVKTPTST